MKIIHKPNSIGMRIKELRYSKGLTQKNFARMIGLNNIVSLSRYENNVTKQNLSILLNISKLFNVSLDWLVTGKGDIGKQNIVSDRKVEYSTSKENLIKIPVRPVPVLNIVPAGFPETPIDDYVIDWVMIPIDIKDRTAFGLIVDGDSMAPKINDKDIIIISPKSKVSSGQIGAFRINSDVTIKKLLIKKGKTYLLPENDEYEPIVLNDGDELIAIGRAIYQIKKL